MVPQSRSGRAVTADDLLSAPVPPLCQHPAGRLVGGSLPIADADAGFEQIHTGGPGVAPVLADLTGDGVGDAAAVVSCSAGGVTWPDTVLLYGPGTALLGSVDLHAVHRAEHATVQSTSLHGTDVTVTWIITEGCCLDEQHWSARLHWNGHQVQVLDASGG